MNTQPKNLANKLTTNSNIESAQQSNEKDETNEKDASLNTMEDKDEDDETVNTAEDADKDEDEDKDTEEAETENKAENKPENTNVEKTNVEKKEENKAEQIKSVELSGRDAETMAAAKNLTKKRNQNNAGNANNKGKNLTMKNIPSNTNKPSTTPSNEAKAERDNNSETKSEIRSLNKVAMNLLNHQIVMKLFHFQTELYGAHKASDAYLEKFALTMDKFLEIAQGIYGRITIKKYTLNGTSHTDENIVKHLEAIINLLRKDIDDILSNYTDLINVRDELVGDAEQLKYLLTFK